MLVYCHQPVNLVLLVFVDDMLLTLNGTTLMHIFIPALSILFVLKDLSDHYFEVQVLSTTSGLFLSQHKNLFGLLRKFHFLNLKSVRTPCVSLTTLSHLMMNYLLIVLTTIAWLERCSILS